MIKRLERERELNADKQPENDENQNNYKQHHIVCIVFI